MTHTETINGQEVIFETLQVAERFEHSTEYFMNGYTTNGVSVGGDTIKSITWTLNKMKECRAKPVLFAGDRFPDEYKTE